MDTLEKLKILTDAAKYDVSCSSSGSSRKNSSKGLGNGHLAGICHSWSEDGRCISLLKILFTNKCIYDCKYCINRSSNVTKRAEFSPREVADLTINFYKRNYIEGLFLSSGVIKNPNYTMELLIKTADILRNEYHYNGYIHMKSIPGADSDLVKKMGLLVDRMSVNVELPLEKSLKILAPQKSIKAIESSMDFANKKIVQRKNEIKLYKHTPKFLPAGQTTQMIIGADEESDFDIVSRAENLYEDYSLKRVFYSAFVPVVKSEFTKDIKKAPLLREHRLYQADWLLRFYGFKSSDLLNEKNKNFDLRIDPKTDWAINNISKFPMEINKASFYDLIKIPGIGITSARKIVNARKYRKLEYWHLKALNISVKKARNFITVNGKYQGLKVKDQKDLKERMSLSDPKSFEQLSFFGWNMKIIVYDGTFEGFLTVIFTSYKENFKVKIESEKDQISFLDQKYIKTNFEKAKRVEDSIKKNISKEFYYDIKIAFKSDYKNKDTIIARLIKLSFLKGEKIIKSTNKYAIAFNKMVKNYSREAHAFKGLLRFKEIQEGFLFAKYESHNDILEDLSRHFLQRMPKEKFVIYDKNRNKAFVSIYGNFEVVEILNLDIKESKKEEFFQNLWIGFYDAIAIKERKNKKLMIENMPKKYWKYLPEKNRKNWKGAQAPFFCENNTFNCFI